MFFSDVSAGDAWQPESAARYNAVNSLLRSGSISGTYESAVNDCRVEVFNHSGVTIPAFTPAAVTGCHLPDDPLQRNCRLAGKVLLEVVPAQNELLPWGIVIQDIQPGSSGVMIISGVVPAYFTGNGRAVTPGSGGLIAGNCGNGLTLLVPEKDLPGLIVLGGGSAAFGDEYRGYFKLEALSMTLLQICNGWQPDSEFCGRSDVPGLDNIPRMELEIPEALTAQLLDIHLVFFYDRASKVYSVKLMYDLPEEMVFSCYIGSFRYGRVTQQYKAEGESDKMIFGNEWYLK